VAPTVVQPPQTVVQPKPTTPPTALVWDAEFKEITAQSGQESANFTFHVTNGWTSEVVVNSVRPSCGCTMAKMPNVPWKLAPGDNGPLEVSIDLRGKRGVLSKSLMVDSTSGFKALMFKVTIPENTSPGSGTMSDPDRLRNMQLAMANRQIVFQGECAKCHAEPAQAKVGQDLYNGACALCHDSPHRATMVPDLKALKHPTNADYWKTWIAHGRVGTLMPAFAKAEGGPLTDEQIDSLVNYLVQTITGPPKQAAAVSPLPTRTTTASAAAAAPNPYSFPFPKSQ
jgi:cytochrome c553